MACPVFQPSSSPVNWGSVITLTAPLGGFGSPSLGTNNPPAGAAAAILMDNGNGLSVPAVLLAPWSDTAITVRLPAAPVNPVPPFRIQITIPRLSVTPDVFPLTPDVCSIPITFAVPSTTHFTPPAEGTGLSSDNISWVDKWFFNLDPHKIVPFPEKELLRQATAAGAKWRYDYLKAQAVTAASSTLAYENQIAHLMSMAVTKVSTAELLASPIFTQVIQTLKNNISQIRSLTNSPQLPDILDQAGKLIAKALLLEMIIRWLAENGPVSFWTGLFNALIDDLASFNYDLDKTSDYLVRTFKGTGQVATAVLGFANDMRNRLDQEIERMAGPLKKAIAQIIGDTSKAMAEVTRSFDNPLLMNPPATAAGGDVPNANPFSSTLDNLEQEVTKLLFEIRSELDEILTSAALGQGDLLAKLFKIYLVLPIFTILAISVAGGPLSAAVLVGVVLLAVQELLHLLARWLMGPVMGKVGELKAEALTALGRLEKLFALEAARLESPADLLRLLSTELRELKNLVPSDFLDQAAQLLGRARDMMLDNATALSLAAEQALGMENAAAFDVIAYRYRAGLAPAAQLPGGNDENLLAGAALLRDLAQLEASRVAMADGKELEITHRLSLFRLFGGLGDPAALVVAKPGGLAELLAQGRFGVELDEGILLDRQFPGLYRALIKEVRVKGVFRMPSTPGTVSFGIPLTLTHLGQSRTRVKRDANAAAPIVRLPDCFPPTSLRFRSEVEKAWQDALKMAKEVAISTLKRQSARARLDVSFTKVLNGNALVETEISGPTNRSQFENSFVDYVPNALRRAISTATCGLIESADIARVARTAIQGAAWNQFTKEMTASWFINWRAITIIVTENHPSEQDLRTELDNKILNSLQAPPKELADAANAAWAEALKALKVKAAKWGEGFMEEDRDPHVRSLGFSVFVRRADPESAVYNLVPDDSLLETRAANIPPVAYSGMAPVVPAATLQYRPFENHGLSSSFLLELADVPNKANLVDLILDITFHACFDQALAATVRSSCRQRQTSLELANAWAAAANRVIQLPGDAPADREADSVLRTFHLSLRSHREILRTMAMAAAYARNQLPSGNLPSSVTVDNLAFDPNAKPLSSVVAFSPLRSPFNRFTFQFTTQKPSSLGALNNAMTILPEDLGLTANLLNQSRAQLVSIGLAIIPSGAAGVANLMLQNVTASGALGNLLPAFNSSAFSAGTRFLTTANANNPQPAAIKDLYTQQAAIDIAFDPNHVSNGFLYDIVLSVTVRHTSTTVAVSAAAVN